VWEFIPAEGRFAGSIRGAEKIPILREAL